MSHKHTAINDSDTQQTQTRRPMNSGQSGLLPTPEDNKQIVIVQEIRQRKYVPPRNSTTQPPAEAEVFVTKLPKDCFEKEILRVFETVGQIYEITIMIDYRGNNRGHCFVQYHTPEEAAKAVEILNRSEIRPGLYVGVYKSVDNFRLFLPGIPQHKTREDIYNEISQNTEEVMKVTTYRAIHDRSLNLGFAFVDYRSHEAAATAWQKLVTGKAKIWGEYIDAKWAEPDEPDSKSLYVRNLLPSTSEQKVRHIFNVVSDYGVEWMNKTADYAFVHFVTREIAEQVKKQLDRTDIDGADVDIFWGRQTDKNKLASNAYSPYGQSPSTTGRASSSKPNHKRSAAVRMSNNRFSPYNVNNSQVMIQYPGVGIGNWMGYYFPLPVGQMQDSSQQMGLLGDYPGVQNSQQPLAALGGNMSVPGTYFPSSSSAVSPIANTWDSSYNQQLQRLLNYSPEFYSSGGQGEREMPFSNSNPPVNFYNQDVPK